MNFSGVQNTNILSKRLRGCQCLSVGLPLWVRLNISTGFWELPFYFLQTPHYGAKWTLCSVKPQTFRPVLPQFWFWVLFNSLYFSWNWCNKCNSNLCSLTFSTATNSSVVKLLERLNCTSHLAWWQHENHKKSPANCRFTQVKVIIRVIKLQRIYILLYMWIYRLTVSPGVYFAISNTAPSGFCIKKTKCLKANFIITEDCVCHFMMCVSLWLAQPTQHYLNLSMCVLSSVCFLPRLWITASSGL